MAVHFRQVSHGPLRGVTVSAPDGAVIGVLGRDGAGKRTLLRLAAGLETPQLGSVEAGMPARLIGPFEPLNFSPVRTLALWHALAIHDELVCRRAVLSLERLRRQGTTVLIVSHALELLRELADECWWLEDGAIRCRGAPTEVVREYQRDLARRFIEWASGTVGPLPASFRRGDGRAELVAIETLDAQGRPTRAWLSGKPAAVAVMVRFHRLVEDPVVGIMLRTRLGLEVYGTNTQLEGIRLGPCQPGDRLRVTYRFICHLCPGDYTVTAASHDPDGVWHDWFEDAIAVSVVDTRYTAGVANLKAQVEVEKL